VPVRLPHGDGPPPIVAIAVRFGIALGCLLVIAVVVYLDRGGYRDTTGEEIGFIDALYFATVTASTTGYGDIAPVTQQARLVDVLVVTPLRLLFVIVLVGTTLEFLATRSREGFRLARWRRRLKDHVIVCGFGVKGRAAVSVLTERGSTRTVVVIDTDPDAITAAEAQGLAVVTGNATREDVLRLAGVETASALVVAASRDDAAVLITLTARELNAGLNIVAAVREVENAHLLRQGGADSVITTDEASGRLLGLATGSPQVAVVIEDLLAAGHGLDIVEREALPEELGGAPITRPGHVVVAVIRGREVLRFDDPLCQVVLPGDRVVELQGQSAR
jgi:voltage-gated potassium channel